MGGTASPSGPQAQLGALHQISPAYLRGDAVGAHMAEVRRTLQDLGLRSEIYVENLHPVTIAECHPLSELPPPDPETAFIYQFATGSLAADVAHARPETLVVNYHNTTPPAYFRPWDLGIAEGLALARLQLDFLGERAALGIGVSAFNTAEMVEAGYAQTAVAPYLFNPDNFGTQPDPATLDRLISSKRGAELLFVGRLAPNKAQHDLVKVLAAYRSVFDGQACLHLVGRPATATYGDSLRRFVATLGLEDAVELVDNGVSPAVLSAYFTAADVLVSASEHEGFCVPLVEAMHHRLPIVAYAAAAVPETLGDAGLVLTDKAPLTVAAAINRVLTDATLRAALAAAAATRLAELSLPRSRAKLVAALEPITGIRAPDERTFLG
jgi:glycosyltransferase involved in cell wall biosynthesis